MDYKTDRTLERRLRIVLGVGIFLSFLVVLIGGFLYLSHHGSEPVGADYSIFHGEPRELRGVKGIFEELLRDRSAGIIQFGILLLIATPLARVAFSIFRFLAIKDRIYICVTIYVFCILIYSLFF